MSERIKENCVERRKKAKKELFTDFHEGVYIRNRRKKDPSKLNSKEV